MNGQVREQGEITVMSCQGRSEVSSVKSHKYLISMSIKMLWSIMHEAMQIETICLSHQNARLQNDTLIWYSTWSNFSDEVMKMDQITSFRSSYSYYKSQSTIVQICINNINNIFYLRTLLEDSYYRKSILRHFFIFFSLDVLDHLMVYSIIYH